MEPPDLAINIRPSSASDFASDLSSMSKEVPSNSWRLSRYTTHTLEDSHCKSVMVHDCLVLTRTKCVL